VAISFAMGLVQRKYDIAEIIVLEPIPLNTIEDDVWFAGSLFPVWSLGSRFA